MIPFMDEDDIDELLKKMCTEPIEGLSFEEVAPFASDEAVDQLFVARLQAGDNVNSLLPFVSEDALHEIAVKYVNGEIDDVSESFLPFMDEDDISMIFKYEITKKH